MATDNKSSADRNPKCAAWVKARGRGNYGQHRCNQDAVIGGYCTRHNEAAERAAAKLAAYASQGKHK